MKIGISGYQSIKKAVIDLNDGEIVGITGDNAVGKSAIERAIRAFIRNSAGKDFINLDLKAVKVLVKTDRGLYRWDKTEKEATYSLGENKLRKINRAPLEDVFPGSGFLVEKEGSDIWVPSMVEEGEQIFPFNVVPSVAFKIFSKFISSPKVGLISKEVKSLIKEDKESLEKTRIQLNVTEQDYSASIRRLSELPPKEVLVKLKDRIAKCKVVKLRLERWEEGLTKGLSRADLESRIRRLTSKEIESVRERVGKVKKGQEKLGDLEEKVRILDSIMTSKSILTSSIEERESFLNRNKGKIEKLKRIEEVLARSLVLGDVDKKKEVLKGLEEKRDVLVTEKKKFRYCPYCNQELV